MRPRLGLGAHTRAPKRPGPRGRVTRGLIRGGDAAAGHRGRATAAQKLLFGHSTHGDLLPYLAGHFDTTTGPKVAAASYTAIAHAIAVASPHILFLTDNVKGASPRPAPRA